MKNTIEIINRRNSVEINIEGTIGVPEEWQFDDPSDRVATYDKFRNAIDLIRQIESPEVLINIRSTGGDVNDALLILDAISGLKAKKTTRCYGYTASAATLIAQAASEGCREISANALYLIHTAICAAEGNAEELEARTELLRKTDERIAAVYASRSGRPVAEFETLMAENNGNGRWLSPDEAVAAGLADMVFNAPEVLNCTVVDDYPIHNYMVKIKNTMHGILRRLGLTPGEATEVEISEEQIATLNQSLEQGDAREKELQEQLADEQAAHEQTRTDLTEVQNRFAELEAELNKRKAAPTVTKEIEDPSIIDEVKLTGNAKAYDEDVKNLK